MCFGKFIFSQQTLVIDSIKIYGNKKTKNKIIIREFMKKSGDTLLSQRLNYIITRSQQNIFNTNLFVFDTVYAEKKDSNKINLHVKVQERWYIWPIPIFEIQDRNFNTWWQTKDLFRINYGIVIDHENFTGLKDKFSLILQRGYSEKYGIVYRKPYINQKQTIGIRTSFFFKQNNELQYNTINNEPLFYRNYAQHIVQWIEAKASATYRKKYFDFHTIELAYNYWHFNDTLIRLNRFFLENSYQNILQYFYFNYNYTFNNTDIQYYPLKGWVVSGSLIKNGLGIKNIENVNNYFIFGAIKKFSKLNSYINLANAMYFKWTESNNISCFFNRSIGYGNNNVRGYEYYIVDGQQYFMTKNSLRFKILKPRTIDIKKLHIPQFNTFWFYSYFNLFFDAAYVQDKIFYQNNFLCNRWIYGYGAGLDFITYYDLVFRIEYAFNHLHQQGIYLHLNMGL